MIKNTDNQKGVSLIIAFFIMIIILAVVISVSILLYNEVKLIRNIGDSMVSFYAADGGIEKVLYYDNKVLPTDNPCETDATCQPGFYCLNGVCTGKRGFCSMCDSGACPPGGDNNILGCGDCTPSVACGAEGECSDCTITFYTTFNDRRYEVRATLDSEKDSLFTIQSKGAFAKASRHVEISIGGIDKSKDPIIVKSACANPKSNPAGTDISIFAYIQTTVPGNEIIEVEAEIYYYNGSVRIPAGTVSLILEGSAVDGRWANIWNTATSRAYYVDLIIKDKLGTELRAGSLSPCIN